MSRTDTSELLRAGLLEGTSIMLARAASAGASGEGDARGPADGAVAAAVHGACSQLGARVADCALACDGTAGLDEASIDEVVDRVLGDAGSIDVLIVDCAGLLACAAGGAADGGRAEDGEPNGAADDAADGVPDAATDAATDGAREALGACLAASWNVTRSVVGRAFLADGRGGRIIFIAPARDAERPEISRHADAARAGLENLARTLSIEWARYSITPVTIAPGERTSAGVLATLSAYLASPAGAYFSGCLLDLRGSA